MAKRPTQTSPQQTPDVDAQSMEKLKQSAGYIIGAIILALVSYFGWTYYQNLGLQADTVAADKYIKIEQSFDEYLTMLERDPAARKQLDAEIDALVAEHGTTVYAWQALMIKARNAVDANDNTTAIDALKKAIEIDLHDAGLHSITQLRYATVLLASGDVDAAMEQASKDVPVPFKATQQELLGDIYLAKKDKEQAIRSYQNAWKLLTKRAEERPILRLKLENLGINPEPMEEPEQIVSLSAMNPQVDSADSESNAEADTEESGAGETDVAQAE